MATELSTNIGSKSLDTGMPAHIFFCAKRRCGVPTQLCPCEGCTSRATIDSSEDGVVCVECNSGEPEFWITDEALPLTGWGDREFTPPGITHETIGTIMEDGLGTAPEDPISQDEIDAVADSDIGGTIETPTVRRETDAILGDDTGVADEDAYTPDDVGVSLDS